MGYNLSMSKQFLCIITGLPYSGKTTLTKELVRRFGFTVASVDEVMEEGHYSSEKMNQDDWNYVYSEAYRRLKHYLIDGNTVIFDGGSLLKSERNTIKGIAEKVGVKSTLIYVKVAKEEIKRRWAENQISKVRDHLVEETINHALSMFEEPTADENPIIYNQEMDVDLWIIQNLKLNVD